MNVEPLSHAVVEVRERYLRKYVLRIARSPLCVRLTS